MPRRFAFSLGWFRQKKLPADEISQPALACILRKRAGVAPNDAGPLWLGFRLISPRYGFRYELQSADGGHYKILAEMSQSEVDENFGMFVPVFANFGQSMLRMGQVAMLGNSTRRVAFIVDRQPKKVALNVYREILER